MNLLASFSQPSDSRHGPAFLAFPMGELNSDLSMHMLSLVLQSITDAHVDISPFIISEDSNLIFTPTTSPIRSFNTPIQQLSASTSNIGMSFAADRGLCSHHPSGSFLAVRTYASTTMFQVIPPSANNLTPAISLKELASIPTSTTARRSVVDISFHPSSADVCMVNDLGAVFRWSLLENRRM